MGDRNGEMVRGEGDGKDSRSREGAMKMEQSSVVGDGEVYTRVTSRGEREEWKERGEKRKIRLLGVGFQPWERFQL